MELVAALLFVFWGVFSFFLRLSFSNVERAEYRGGENTGNSKVAQALIAAYSLPFILMAGVGMGGMVDVWLMWLLRCGVGHLGEWLDILKLL